MRQIGVKLLRLVLVLFFVTFFAFYLVSLLPGDPVTNFAGIGADEAKLDEIRADLGLDEPVIVRYFDWLGAFLTGDLGKYYGVAGDSPADKLLGTGNVGVEEGALLVSLQLMTYTMIFGLAIAIPLGVVTAYRANSVFDKGTGLFAFLALSIPAFVLAYLFKQVFTINWQVLPERGWEKITEVGLIEHLKFAILPVLCLAMAQIAVYQRLLRSDMIATLQEDYITMAKSKGLSNKRILFRHALRPSSLTLLTIAGLNIGTLIGGAVVIERIFGIPGLGTLTIEAFLSREYVALSSFIAVIGVFYVLVNFAVDFFYTVLDPRIRYG